MDSDLTLKVEDEVRSSSSSSSSIASVSDSPEHCDRKMQLNTETLKKSCSSKFERGCGPGMIVGLPQTWPIFEPMQYYDESGACGYFGVEGMPSKVSTFSFPSTSSTTPAMVGEETQGNLVEVNDSGIPEVSFPKQLSIQGKSKRQLEQMIQRYCDKLAKIKIPQQVAAELTSQIFQDNDELLYVLVTDVDAYPVMSKSLPWIDDDLVSVSNSAEYDEFAFHCLFEVAEETFALFLFSPLDIIFFIEAEIGYPQDNFQWWKGPVTSIFFYGTSKVGVSLDEVKKSITIQFFEDREQVHADGETNNGY